MDPSLAGYTHAPNFRRFRRHGLTATRETADLQSWPAEEYPPPPLGAERIGEVGDIAAPLVIAGTTSGWLALEQSDVQFGKPCVEVRLIPLLADRDPFALANRHGRPEPAISLSGTTVPMHADGRVRCPGQAGVLRPGHDDRATDKSGSALSGIRQSHRLASSVAEYLCNSKLARGTITTVYTANILSK